MTTVILRPNATVTTQSVSLTGAATADAALSDSSDASYITATAAYGYALLSLDTTALPAGAQTSTIELSFRANDSAALFPSSVATLSILGELGLTRVLGSVSGSVTLATTTSPPFATGNLSQAYIDALQVAVSLPDSGSIAYEVFASLSYAGQPTTTVSAPAGAQPVSAPVVTWLHTPGTDGSSQARYHVRIFSAAQYGVSGFAPGSSPCTWDSGDTAGTAISLTAGTLDNLTTYRAYVRTAQTTGGVAHWAEWAYSSFSTSYVTPDVASVTVTGDNTNARHRITVTRDTGTPNWLTFDVERSDDSGTTWVPVRGATAATPPGDVWIGYDYEGGNGVATLFRARASTATITGPWVTSTAATWSSDDHWLKDLLNPGNSMALEISAMPQRKWGIVQGVHRPVGRVDPVVVSDLRQAHTATVTFEAYTAAEAIELRALLDGQQLLLQIATGLGYPNIYLVPGDVSERHGSEQIGSEWRYIDVSYVEVARPADDGATTIGLTWQDVADSYATWQDLLDAGMTWGGLV